MNIIRLPGAAHRPDGDVVLADVAREDASVVLSDLKALDLYENGSIMLQEVDTASSKPADETETLTPGAPADAVVWEEVEQSTSENVELSAVFLLFMVLIVGAMVVGPEFGPIAGFCVALGRRDDAHVHDGARSVVAVRLRCSG